jgi:hypothetical protein
MGKTERSIIRLLELNPGLSDKEIAHAIKARRESPQYINQKCRSLASQGILLRKKRADGLIGNWLTEENCFPQSINQPVLAEDTEDFLEKKIKKLLETYLISHGWETSCLGFHMG